MIEHASGYCTLEYNVESGKRGKRGGQAEHLLAELTGAEAGLIVNNCAAAAVLVLTALSKGGEAIVSRGEMVEIGGDFRIPDVMTQSGAVLREVGTTNRTSVADYESALNENTRLIVKVHPSNYRIVGFTASPGVNELAKLAHRNDLLLYEDAGSGALIDLSEFGLKDEPIISQSIVSGADIVTFSGDKLLGGTQAGLIVGRGEIIGKIRKHPLYRALRVSKLIYAALEATFEAFRKETVTEEIPVLRMLTKSEEDLRNRSIGFVRKLKERIPPEADFMFNVFDGNSVVGGGSAPAVQPATALISIERNKHSISEFEEKLRRSDPTVVTRVFKDRVVLDLRTVSDKEESELLEILYRLCQGV
jgi:L-seryl-tRNA(Ser) seleniumtransferase